MLWGSHTRCGDVNSPVLIAGTLPAAAGQPQRLRASGAVGEGGGDDGGCRLTARVARGIAQDRFDLRGHGGTVILLKGEGPGHAEGRAGCPYSLPSMCDRKDRHRLARRSRKSSPCPSCRPRGSR